MTEEKDAKELERRIREVQEVLDKKDEEAAVRRVEEFLAEEGKKKQVMPKEPADLAKIVSVYEALFGDDEADMKDHYNAANSLIADKKTIYQFVALLPKYQKQKFFSYTGYFISGLINNLDKNEEVELDLTHLGHHYITAIGEKLAIRTLRIKGHAGSDLGYCMESGEIIVDGSAGSVASFMHGGRIVVNGETHSIGMYMYGGEVHINGNIQFISHMHGGKVVVEGNVLGKHTGNGMEAGEIHINGSYVSLSKRIEGGEIYHKGKRIFPK